VDTPILHGVDSHRLRPVDTLTPETLSPEIRVPAFLTCLDTRPDEAFQEFYQFAQRQLIRVPPAPSRRLSPDERQDLFHDIVFHCVREKFRVLKQYQDRGYNFAAWFQVVAYRQTLLYVRKRGPVRSVSQRNSPEPSETPSEHKPVLDSVWQALSVMDVYCRRLLLLAAEEYTPREIVRAWGLAASDNKKVGDQIRECRKKLKARLDGAGVEWREYV
jgi:DNA-directed RNA polymerase specialized sigma24 family protein